eukprot:TRINITY_DN50689_c0_g1_i1.p1 TRINITY_DN50689_c0_g1~~TRINITY_DN50689_c0_g1_i1.p1  ORF type:complete len:494 (+),score=96.51 TRINITY_DN50689_c0_g1_i1:45-1526(+)
MWSWCSCSCSATDEEAQTADIHPKVEQTVSFATNAEVVSKAVEEVPSKTAAAKAQAKPTLRKQLSDTKLASVDTMDDIGDLVRRKRRNLTVGDQPTDKTPIESTTRFADKLPESPKAAVARRDKRAQTLPVRGNVGRGRDYSLSHLDLKALQQAQVDMKKTLSSKTGLHFLTQREISAFCEEHTTGFVHGLLGENQKPADPRSLKWYGIESISESVGAFLCRKGDKGDTSPNQDNFSVTFFKNGWTLVCCHDGHGTNGHLVSLQTVQTVPYFLAKESFVEKDIPASLTTAFEKAQDDVVAMALEDAWDIQASGSTAVAALWKGSKIFTANIGDSRCVIAEEHRKILFETEDHKPLTPKEKARIEASGGEIRTEVYPDGWKDTRMFVAGEDFPGIAMTRTFGDCSVKAHGVIATPEVKLTELKRGEKPWMVLASDGVWEFLESDKVMKHILTSLKGGTGAQKTVEELFRMSKRRWLEVEGDYCDDITAVLMRLA